MSLKLIFAYALLLVGLCLAAAFGSRNSPQLTSYRAANGIVDQVCDEICDNLACAKACSGSDAKAWQAQLALIQPSSSLMRHRRAAVAERAHIGLPAPKPRLMGWLRVGGLGWLLGVVLIGVGALIARRAVTEQVQGGDNSELLDFPQALRELLERLEVQATVIADLHYDDDAPAVRAEIDALFDSLLGPVVEGRARLMAKHGLGGFAEYFGAFSGGERNLARCWSALTDGHAGEARASLQRARGAFRQALEVYERVDGATAPTS